VSSWPWFPFYVNDFLASSKVRSMDAAEVGTYLLLMLEQWQEGIVKADDMAELARKTKSTPEMVEKVLRTCFKKTRRGWFNVRLRELADGQDAKSGKAKASAKARWKAISDANALRPQSERNASQNQNHSQNHTPPSVEAGERKAKRKAALPSDWKPNEGHHSQAGKNGLNVELEAEQFRDYHTAKGSVMLDWDAAFRTWLRNAVKFQARDSKRPSEDAAQALLARQAEGWTERRRATEEAIARDLAKRTTAPPIANEPSGPLGGTLARVLSAVQPGGNAA
jgi:uncharacterized protein YdaU (DUF1376 family)